MKKALSVFLILGVTCTLGVHAQVARHDKAVFVTPKNEFMDSVRKAVSMLHAKSETPRLQLQLDFSGLYRPASTDQFKQFWHNKPVSQAISGMCWCFSTTSYLESEIYRLSKREIKLSELYTVYWEYVAKTKRFVAERGNSNFGEGSEANAVMRIWKQYGIVPAESYSGMLPGQKFHDHSKLFEEMNNYLQSLKVSNAWAEEIAVNTIKSILNHYIGEPPKTVIVGGTSMTPQEYLQNVIRLNMDDYVEVMSLMEKPYYQMAEYEVPDNWWHSKEYFNIPLNEFMTTIRNVFRAGGTVCIGGDVSEPGYEGHAGAAIVPTFDIPSEYIDESARQFRFSNGTTSDDHGIHMVGYLEKDGKEWYLIKDSGSGSRNNPHPGYYFYSEDYVKLKMLGITVHKEYVKDLLQKQTH